RDAKVRRGDTHFDVALYNLAKVEPRETATVRLAVADVPASYRALRAAVEKAKGRVVAANVNERDRQNVTAQFDFEVRRADERERSGRVTGHLVYDVPPAAAAGVVERFRGAGTVRVHEANRQPQAVEGKLATARIDVTVSNSELIVGHDDGLWPQVRKGLSYSV